MCAGPLLSTKGCFHPFHGLPQSPCAFRHFSLCALIVHFFVHACERACMFIYKCVKWASDETILSPILLFSFFLPWMFFFFCLFLSNHVQYQKCNTVSMFMGGLKIELLLGKERLISCKGLIIIFPWRLGASFLIFLPLGSTEQSNTRGYTLIIYNWQIQR